MSDSSHNSPASSASRRIQLLAHGPVPKTLFSLAAPAIAGMLVLAVYNVVDTVFVSFLRDTTAIAATGIVFPLFQLIGAVGLTFGMGAASVISRRMGENKYKEAEQSGATAFYSSLAAGLLLSLIGAIFIEPILRVFGATDSIIAQGSLYGRIILGGSVFQILNMTLNNLLRSEGASLYSSMGQILGAVLNIILDPIFIFVLDMGITGAAVATIIAQSVSTAFLISFYLRGRGAINPLRPGSVRINLPTYRAIMALGAPTLVRQLLGSVSFGILNNAASAFGDAAIAAISVTMRIFMLLLMALIGLAQGLQPLVGYNYGSGNIPRVREGIRVVYITAALVGLVAGIIAMIFAPGIMRFFAPQDPDVIRMGSMAMRYMAVVMVPTGLLLMFGGIFQALGDGRSAMILAAGQQGGFLIPLVIFLPKVLGIHGVFLAQPAGFLFSFFIGLILIRKSSHALSKAERELSAAAP
ncbi:MATE family efflux transporter [Salinispira pacifica]|uniref:Multidrug export protein MepA n=1 Tax=Salinispira pacifica TaxID=1307761 RepID=V5WLY3_9SPIO|nr:MATE family efflux transporter [Salinispira pacifica]AHC16101.1 Multi antimicrobial extrusion protein (Na(+)/drug antiporter) [Salinispira pacifica]